MTANGNDPKFNMIWRDLDRALSMPVFTKHETSLMQVARELSYTASVVEKTRRARPFRIHVGKLAARRGLTRENLSRALTDLLTDHVLVGTRDRLRINKHYKQWAGKHALSVEQLGECLDAIDNPVTDCGDTLPLTEVETEDISTDYETPCDEKVTPVTKKSHREIPQGVMKKSQCDEKVTDDPPSPVTKKSQSCDEKVTESPPPLEPPSRKQSQSDIRTPGEESASIPSLRIRQGEDLLHYQTAVNLLASDARTERLAGDLGRFHNSATDIQIGGWRWLVGAFRVSMRNNAGSYGIAYLRKVAVNATTADLEEALAAMSPVPFQAESGPLPRASAYPRKQTASERLKAESEAMHRAVASLPSEEDILAGRG